MLGINLGIVSFIFHKKAELKRWKQKNLALRQQVENLSAEIEREKQIFAQGNIARINFFQINHVSPHEWTSFFLRKIATLASAKKIKVFQIKPLPKEETSYFTKIPFIIKTKATYSQMLSLLKDLEYTLGLNVEKINVIKDPSKPTPILTVELNSIEMKGKNFSQIKIKTPLPRFPKTKRDPFSTYILKSQASQKKLPSNRILISLQGIMRYKNIYEAMINTKVVKKGEVIKGYKVYFIGKDRVVLFGNGNYIVLKPGTKTELPRIAQISEDITKFINKWKQAWENKDIEGYLQCYASNFSFRGMDRKAWANYKKGLFKRYHQIKITLSDFKQRQKHDCIEVTFKQHFVTDKYSDVGLKILLLKKESGEWKIVKESWQPIPN